MKLGNYYYQDVNGKLLKHPTILVPSGKQWNKGYPRVVRVGTNGKVYATRLTTIKLNNHGQNI